MALKSLLRGDGHQPAVRRVLVATDRSETAEQAVSWAAEMAERYEAELVLVQIVVPPNEVDPAVTADLAIHAQDLAGSRGRAVVAVHIGRVMAKYGLREQRSDGDLRDRARSLRSALEELGPTFAKLGQILSTRPDLLPSEFIEELSTLQDQVPPLTEAEVVSVMEEELGVPWEDVFASIDPVPLAAGTIGQVHRATLENGDRVVAKVQRPGASDEILRDLGLLQMFAERTENRAELRRVVDVPRVIE